MSQPWRFCSVLLCAGIAIFSLAAGPNPIKELNPREVRFPAEKITLSDALDELQKQTGNVVKDTRADKTNPFLTFPNGPTTFWRTLDAIGKQTTIGFSAYQPDGGVALIDRPYRELIIDYSGLFRFAEKGVAVSRDAETKAHFCRVTFDVAWEPRFRPLFLNFEQGEIVFSGPKPGTPRREKLERQTAREVVGAGATDIEVRVNAPPRATQKIDSFSGTLRVIGVPKMLEFKFTELVADAIEVQDRVKVRLTDVKKLSNRWEIDLQTDEPDGLETLESFQRAKWSRNNRIWLKWGNSELEPSGRDSSKKGPGTIYHFTPTKDTPLPELKAAVVLHYRTANRVVAFTVPFSFRDLPLP